MNISYLSKRFLILYLSISIFRQKNKYHLTSITKVPIKVNNYKIFDNSLDKLVNNVEITLPKIHKIISINQIIFKDDYNIKLNNIQISTLSLIAKKWLNITASVKRKSLKIILVTNIVYERVQFFEELIKSYYDVKLVGVFTLYDIEKIKTIDYDFIILFSNRMLSVIKEEFKNAIKVNFFLINNNKKQ